jgi:hypothetical protein
MASPPSSQSPSRSRGGEVGTDGTHSHDNSPDFDSSIAINKNDKQWENRAADEARFEAVLEAERRRASRT